MHIFIFLKEVKTR